MVVRVVLLICSLLATSVVAKSYEDILEQGQITIAVYNNFPPYSYLKDGEPAGVDIEVGKRIAADWALIWSGCGSTPTKTLRMTCATRSGKGILLPARKQT